MAAQVRNSSGWQREAYSMSMPSVLVKQIGARLQGIEQVESMDGTPGTMCFIPVTRNHQRRSSIAFHHSCSSNSDDAAVPAVTIDHDAEGLAQRWILLEAMFNFLENDPSLREADRKSTRLNSSHVAISYAV